jgi:hypothetical protein
LDSNPWSSHDLREDPQLKGENPQFTPKVSQVVGPLQAYLNRPSHGGKEDGKSIVKNPTYDLMNKVSFGTSTFGVWTI